MASSTSMTGRTRLRRSFHPDAYKFVFQALQFTQEQLERPMNDDDPEDESAHISGPELLEGVRQLAHKQYGLLARTVFESWNVGTTDDFGRIVFELIERGEMRKTDNDQEADFCGVYPFERALEREYVIETSEAFA